VAVIRNHTLPSRSLAEWDRATRSLCDGINIMDKVNKRGAYMKVSDRSGLDLSTPTGRGILALLSGLAEEGHHRILKRANEGRLAAIKRGIRPVAIPCSMRISGPKPASV
jgi:DNA invertase Pin-like site-specific DNA recombinase